VHLIYTRTFTPRPGIIGSRRRFLVGYLHILISGLSYVLIGLRLKAAGRLQGRDGVRFYHDRLGGGHLGGH